MDRSRILFRLPLDPAIQPRTARRSLASPKSGKTTSAFRIRANSTTRRR